MISPTSTPNKSKLEKENWGHSESLSKSIISEGYEQREIYDCNKEISSKINRNLISPCNSVPRFIDDVVY